MKLYVVSLIKEKWWNRNKKQGIFCEEFETFSASQLESKSSFPGAFLLLETFARLITLKDLISSSGVGGKVLIEQTTLSTPLFHLLLRLDRLKT